MTRASKEARTRTRWREQAARLVVEALWCAECNGAGAVPDTVGDGEEDAGECRACAVRGYSSSCHECGGSGTLRICPRCKGTPGPTLVDVLEDGEPFDVARVRSYCERIIAEAAEREQERVVFIEWCRDRGLGPESFDNADASALGIRCKPWVISLSAAHARRGSCWRCGGWPGSLARAWAWETCKTCEGQGRWVTAMIEARDSVTTACPDCRGRGRVRRKGYRSDAAAGPGLARTAQRLLDTLDGRCPWAPSAGAQASECQECKGSGSTAPGPLSWDALMSDSPLSWANVVGEDCHDCRGTGHNLAGVLPPVEDSEAAIASTADALRSLAGVGPYSLPVIARSLAGWQRSIYERNRERAETMAHRDAHGQLRTRVAPRGEHDRASPFPTWPTDRPDIDKRIDVRGWYSNGVGFFGSHPRQPRWRRGEIRHAEQRKRSS